MAKRWCSDGFEFRCGDGAKLGVIFAMDCCDREAIGGARARPGTQPGNCLRTLQRAASAQRLELSLTEGVQALGSRINLTGGRVGASPSIGWLGEVMKAECLRD